MSDYLPTIGLEVHAELKTRTKMFCDSRNDPDETRPNVNICPICMAHPGTLPVINKEAVRHVLRVGLALDGELADFTEFDRKNYFYPDIPKGYQISQYKYPLIKGGTLNGIAVTRVHLEEDTARSLHENPDRSLIDFNRAGLPLMELVTEPVIHESKDAVAFAKELQLLLRTLKAGDANMEKGEMRVEANVSVGKDGKLGTKVEVKNLNSFRAVERAIEYEVKRQIEALEKGETVIQETRGWDDVGEKTFSQRLKEDSHDYRYFPDPDLPKLELSKIPEFDTEILKRGLPELPWARRKRYSEELGIKKEDASMYVAEEKLGKFFEDAIREFQADKKLIQLASNYITSDLVGLYQGKEITIDPHDFGALIQMIATTSVSSRGAKDILAIMVRAGGKPEEIGRDKGLLQKSDEADLVTIIEGVIAQNAEVADEYKAGKKTALQFLIGQAMKASKGSANPQFLKKLFVKNLG